MSPPLLFYLIHFLFLLLPSDARRTSGTFISQNDCVVLSLLSSSASVAGSVSCPLNFTLLTPIYRGSSTRAASLGVANVCHYISQGLRLVESDYLRRTDSFLPPSDSAESCWDSYQSLVDDYIPDFDIRSACGFQIAWISDGCMNITTRVEFESLVPISALDDVVSRCNQSLENGSPCASCTTALSTLQASYLTGKSVGNLSDCTAYPSIYAAAFANVYGPTNPGTAECLFSLNFSDAEHDDHRVRKLVACVIGAVCFVLLALICSGCFLCWRRKRVDDMKKRAVEVSGSGSGFGSSTHLIKFTLDEIRAATGNFSRLNLVGRGGYGNVYKGLLPDGSTEVAVKRFKNMSASGDVDFAHEVGVIASIRHVNLVALLGYCVETNPMEGYQRIIVCDLMKNGSLHDHLFGDPDPSRKERLSWPTRQRIALGMARGLCYLHYGAQPAIIHRDIKASNILLDDNFEAKVGDFGLAKFAREGASHLSTRVAGTMGYVAPEYALYGQLTERCDVYSFGVVLLELLSGKKAIINSPLEDGAQHTVLTDWAWSLARKGKALDVVEDGMREVGLPALMEKYVLVAVLCSHPQSYARPTMDQVVKILETEDVAVPSIPERPIPLIAPMEDIERSVSSCSSSRRGGGSGQMYTNAGYQTYTIADNEDDGGSSRVEGSGDNKEQLLSA